MTYTKTENEVYFQSDTLYYNDQINKSIQQVLPRFDKIAKSYVLFNMTYLVLGVIEATLFIIFFSSLVQSALLAFCLALIFLTIFSYFCPQTLPTNTKSRTI